MVDGPRRFAVHANAAAKRVRRSPSSRTSPVVITRVNPEVLKTALKLAGGDARRLKIQKDGSVIVN